MKTYLVSRYHPLLVLLHWLLAVLIVDVVHWVYGARTVA
jgi:hypothetical protein